MKEIYRSERSEAMADIYKDVMYDYCAILIISILIITTILRRMVKGKVNRSFMEVLVVAWLAVCMQGLWGAAHRRGDAGDTDSGNAYGSIYGLSLIHIPSPRD